jgi:hypothetical protein
MICPAGEVCVGGNCRLPCVDDTGCTRAGDSCVCRETCVDTAKRCETPRGMPSTCDADILCPPSETCEPDIAGGTTFHCQRACTTDDECDPDQTGETCQMGPSGMRCTSVGDLDARMIAVATVDRAILVAYARDDASRMRDGCGPDAPMPPPLVPLRVNFAHRDTPPSTTPIVISSRPAELIGETRDTAPPAMLGVAGFGFIVAFVDDTDNIVFRHVSIAPMGDGYDFTVEPAPLLTIPVGTGEDAVERGHLALALGATSGGMTTVGLAYRSGCANDADVFVRLLQLDATAGTLAPLSMPALVPGGETVSNEHPSIAFSETMGTWLVAAEANNRTVEGRRFVMLDTMALDFPEADPYILLPATTDSSPNVSQTPFAFPTTSTFGIVAHLGRDADNMPGFYGSDLLCLTEGTPDPDAGM